MCRLLFPLAIVIAGILCSCANLRRPSALDRLNPCKPGEGPSDGYCGSLDVWEDRAARSGRKIPLKILVLPALKQKFAPDPLFFLAGGPGQGAAQLADQIEEPFRRLEADRDLVLVDQRGTGKSNPLECKPGKEVDSENDFTEAEVRRLRACLDSYKSRADVTKYTTPLAMDDLDDVREYLGYSRINLCGGSYGTRAALVYARRHRDRTRAVIIDGVAPTDMRIPLYMARDSQRALELLFRDCESDPGCAKRFPELRERLQTLLARLAAHPQHVRYTDPRTGLPREMDVKRLTVAGILFAALYTPMTASLVPLLIEEAERGDYTGLLALGAPSESLIENMAQGMHFSVVCSEDAPRIEPGSVEREAAGTYIGAELAEIRLQVCAFWPHTRMDSSFYENLPSDVPGLILSGELDPVTPPEWGQMVASQWKNARHIVVPASGHGTWSRGCVLKLMAKFLNDGTAANLDTSCVQQIQRAPFFLGPSGPDPQAGVSPPAQELRK